MDYREWFIRQFDEYIAGEVAGSGVEKSRDGVAHAYNDAVEAGELKRQRSNLIDEGRELFNRYVLPAREARRNGIRTAAQPILDALNDDTILGLNDPVLSQAYPIGDGTDKTLRNWTVDDWTVSTNERYRNAARVTAAAKEYDEEVATPIIKALRRFERLTTGELLANERRG